MRPIAVVPDRLRAGERHRRKARHGGKRGGDAKRIVGDRKHDPAQDADAGAHEIWRPVDPRTAACVVMSTDAFIRGTRWSDTNIIGQKSRAC